MSLRMSCRALIQLGPRACELSPSASHEGSQPLQPGGDHLLPAIAHIYVVFQADVPDQVLDAAQLAERRQDAFGVGRQGPDRPVASQQGGAQRGKVRVILHLKGRDSQVIEEWSVATVVKVEQVDLPVM